MFTNFFIGALYLQHIKGFSAIGIGLAFLPSTLALATLSVGITARLMARFGARSLLVVGLLTISSALLLLSGADEQTSYFPRIFAAYLLFGLGAGLSFMPILTISMSEVPAADAGLASGFGNLSMQMGASVGLAALGTISTDHAKSLVAQGASLSSALTGGYQIAFLLAAACVAAGLLVVLLVLRSPSAPHIQRAPQEERATRLEDAA